MSNREGGLVGHSEISRRHLLIGAAATAAATAAGSLMLGSANARAAGSTPNDTASEQGLWRFCGKCKALYYDGYPDYGVCAAGGGHAPEGWNFHLPYGVSGPGQPDWRYCYKCKTLFYDGYDFNKGHCPVGGSHAAAGFNFVLRYDSDAPGQPDWRFCGKCSALFFDGYDDKGRCAAGGAHAAAGFDFRLSYT